VQFTDHGNQMVGVMHPGDRTSFTFTSPGTYHYECSFHPQNMRGIVVVH